MSGQDADECEGYRQHDDDGGDEAFEPGDDEHVHEDEDDAEGDAHVAEDFVGDLPLAIPLDGVGVFVFGHAVHELGDGFAVGGFEGIDLGHDVENSVDGALAFAADFARHIDHAAEVFVVDEGFALGEVLAHHFADGDEVAGCAVDADVGEVVDGRAFTDGEFDHDFDGFAVALCVEESGGFAVEGEADGVGDGVVGDA